MADTTGMSLGEWQSLTDDLRDAVFYSVEWLAEEKNKQSEG